MFLAQNLKYLRERKGVTQKEIAKKLQVSEMTISRYESGENEPSLTTVMDLAFYFNVTVDELIAHPYQPLFVRNIRYLQNKYEITDRELALLIGYKGEELKVCLQTGIENYFKAGIDKISEYFGIGVVGNLYIKDFSKGGV